MQPLWFEVKLKYEKEIEAQDGRVKKVSEVYLIDAVSFTEAEKRMLIEVDKMGQGKNFIIDNIKKSNINEVIPADSAGYWYKIRITVSMITEDDGGKKKSSSQYFLVAGDDFKEAFIRLEKELEYMVVPYSITSMVVSPILDVFPYEEQAPDGFRPMSAQESKDYRAMMEIDATTNDEADDDDDDDDVDEVEDVEEE
ncbi:MAG: DUF4494 domain-containing protein [Mangrovibacterium sp.]